MKELNPIFTREEFDSVLSINKLPKEVDLDYLYNVYKDADESIRYLNSTNSTILKSNISHVELIYYCLGELVYSVVGKNEEQLKKFYADEEIEESMASVAADKYLTLSQYNNVGKQLTNRFLPPASSLDIYLNFMMNILTGYEKNDPETTIIRDLLVKSLSISRCILINLINGYETEAFSSWRTLHECECTLILLDKYGDRLINRYLRHMNFGLAFNNTIPDKEQQDKIFYEMKEEMRGYGLKSKDIRKYIEYGWLYEIVPEEEKESFKLNFRDGLEKLAGLEVYAKRYEISSEIIHSTPLLIYSNKEYFYYMTLLSLYESFFRLEQVFVSLFSKRVSEEQMKQYQEMRKVYYAQLVIIHKRELQAFRDLQKKWNQKKATE